MARPDDPDWLGALVARSALLPDPALCEQWQHVLAWLPTALRYELAGILMDVELACQQR